MERHLAIVWGALLVFPLMSAAQTPQPKTVSKKPSGSSAKATGSSAKATVSTANKPVLAKPAYAELTIGELIAEDANRWSDKMSTRAAVGGFVTQVAKGDDGDTDIRICENPKVEGMD